MTNPLDLSAPQWRDRLLDEAARAGKITLASVPAWRQRFDKDPADAETALASLAAVPSVAEANLKALDTA
jgi:hypothetical protein